MSLAEQSSWTTKNEKRSWLLGLHSWRMLWRRTESCLRPQFKHFCWAVYGSWQMTYNVNSYATDRVERDRKSAWEFSCSVCLKKQLFGWKPAQPRNYFSNYLHLFHWALAVKKSMEVIRWRLTVAAQMNNKWSFRCLTQANQRDYSIEVEPWYGHQWPMASEMT